MNEGLRPFTKDRMFFDFRIATAVWGTLFAVALLISSVMPWIEDRHQPGPYGDGTGVGRTVWTLASVPGGDESDPRQWWARLALLCLVVTVLVAVGAAASGSRTVARVVGVTGGCTVVAMAIMWLVHHSDAYFRPAGGLYVALIVAVALTVWGFVVAAAASEYDVWLDATQAPAAPAEPATGA